MEINNENIKINIEESKPIVNEENKTINVEESKAINIEESNKNIIDEIFDYDDVDNYEYNSYELYLDTLKDNIIIDASLENKKENTSEEQIKKKRGRPRKIKIQVVKEPKKRGRPLGRKNNRLYKYTLHIYDPIKNIYNPTELFTNFYEISDYIGYSYDMVRNIYKKRAGKPLLKFFKIDKLKEENEECFF